MSDSDTSRLNWRETGPLAIKLDRDQSGFLVALYGVIGHHRLAIASPVYLH